MKKVIIALIVVVLVLGIGTGGVLFWGRTNAKADTAYAEKAKTLVNDYDKKYTDKYFEKQLNEQLTDDTKISKVKESLEDAKKEAQSDLDTLKATKSSKRIASVKKDAEDYFNITISSIDNTIAYTDYMKTLAKATVELEAVNMGGQISSIEGAAAQFDLAKKGVDKAISELETASVPDAMKDFNAEFKKALTEMSATLDGMSTALKAGNIALFESYTSKMESIVKDMENITIPTSSAVTKNIISAEDQKKLDEIPGKLTTEANTFAKKTFAF